MPSVYSPFSLQAKGAKRQAAPPSGPRIITLQRTNNVGALLARLKLSPQQAKQALLHLLGDDDDAMEGEPVRELEEDDIESLLQCLPTEVRNQRTPVLLSAFCMHIQFSFFPKRFIPYHVA